jgi:hypothetical protein
MFPPSKYFTLAVVIALTLPACNVDHGVTGLPAPSTGLPAPSEETDKGPPRPGDMILLESNHQAIKTPLFRLASDTDTRGWLSRAKADLYAGVDRNEIPSLPIPGRVVCCVSPFTDSGVLRSLFKVKTEEGVLGWVLSDEVHWRLVKRNVTNPDVAERLETDPPKTPAELEAEAKTKREGEQHVAILAFLEAYFEEPKLSASNKVVFYQQVVMLMRDPGFSEHPVRREAVRRALTFRKNLDYGPRDLPLQFHPGDVPDEVIQQFQEEDFIHFFILFYNDSSHDHGTISKAEQYERLASLMRSSRFRGHPVQREAERRASILRKNGSAYPTLLEPLKFDPGDLPDEVKKLLPPDRRSLRR